MIQLAHTPITIDDYTSINGYLEPAEFLPNRRLQRTAARNQAILRFAFKTVVTLALVASASLLQAQSSTTQPTAQKSKSPFLNNNPDPATSSLQRYLARVKDQAPEDTPPSGSIWTENGRLAQMNADVRAHRTHDLIQVVVNESLTSSTDGTVKDTRASNASSAVSSLFGALHTGNALNNLLNQTSSSGLSASGTSQSNSSLSTTFGGQVVEVLSNGTLVIEAARQVEFNQQTQTIILRGLVRPDDISQANQVVSTAIASLELEVKGKGIINDATHRQSLLVRLLEHAIIF